MDSRIKTDLNFLFELFSLKQLIKQAYTFPTVLSKGGSQESVVCLKCRDSSAPNLGHGGAIKAIKLNSMESEFGLPKSYIWNTLEYTADYSVSAVLGLSGSN